MLVSGRVNVNVSLPGYFTAVFQDVLECHIVLTNIWDDFIDFPLEKLIVSAWVTTLKWYTLPEANIAPENGPSQKESSLPSTIFQGLLVC